MAETRKKCDPDCTCKRHSRKSVIDWNDPEQRRTYGREKARAKYAENPEPIREAARKWRAANPGRNGRPRDRDAEMLWRYGLTMAQIDQIREAQQELCYLCGEPLDFETPRAVHTDHDHECCRGRRSCGKCIRGLTCRHCNAGIGHFGDDPERMRRVADNLERANARVREQDR